METSPSFGPFKFKLPYGASITLKLLFVGLLTLVLLIPAVWIMALIEERQERAEGVVDEIAEKWSGRQTLGGPILVVPYTVSETVRSSAGDERTVQHTEYAYFLPEQLTITGKVEPEVLSRGIFDAVVYRSTLSTRATFKAPDFESLEISPDVVQWANTRFVVGIKDLGGISVPPVVSVGGTTLETEPIADIYGRDNVSVHNASPGIASKTGWLSAADFKPDVEFTLNLKGSQTLNFIPAGKATTVNLEGAWGDPSFDGRFLPETRTVNEADFSAQWNILHYNRPFPQQWTGNQKVLEGSEFGVNLLVPIDQYQKSMRTSKYAILIILLTFVSLFMVEIIRKIRIHPFQYALIGAALIIYYTLLLSISEHLGFNAAYWIATAATVLLVSWYARTFLNEASHTILFSLMLTVFYAFIFVIILQQDFSLLIGSIGLFLVIGLLMYFSRKITWYKESEA
jgi:inner membrane protein